MTSHPRNSSEKCWLRNSSESGWLRNSSESGWLRNSSESGWLKTQPRNSSEKCWLKIPYLGKISLKISRILKSCGLRSAFYTVNRARDLFVKLKDPLPPEEKSGVYKLNCSDCSAVYIGQTGRKLTSRVLEHERAVRLKTPEKSAFAAHLLDTQHTFDKETGAHLLHCMGKGRKLSALETVEIIHAKNDPRQFVVNDDVPTSTLVDACYAAAPPGRNE